MRWKLDAALSRELRVLSQRENASLFTIFYTAWSVLLHRYSGVDDILVGIPLADRDSRELENVIGFLLHVHVLRTRFSSGASFRELLASTRKQVLDVYAHRRVPFDRVVHRIQPKRNPSYSPLFQMMFVWRDHDQQLSFIGMDGLNVESLLAESQTSKFDLTLFATDTREGAWLELEYSTDLFDEARIQRMFGHMQTLLAAAAADPSRPVAELPLLTAEQRQQILRDTNVSECVWPDDLYVHELIEEQTRRSPDAIAVVYRGAALTYRELNDRANEVAAYLRTLGVGPGALVGICVERSASMVTGLLGILKAGGTYLPLDPSYPRERIAFIVQDAKPLVILTARGAKDCILAYESQIVDLDSLPRITDYETLQDPVRPPRTPGDLAYVLYTSGSTGTPKGVQIPQRALGNFLRSMQRKPGIVVNDVLLAVTTLSFDIAGLELFLPLVSGARIVIAEDEVLSDGAALASLMHHSGATIMQATPATWRMLLEAGWPGDQQLKILCGGESWRADLAEQLLPKCQSLWNMYGPTETTIWSSVAQVEKGRPVLIGPPIDNTRFYVLDNHGEPVPAGIPGELYIAGDGVAVGYLNRPDLISERFLRDSFSSDPAARMFKTGDLVRRVEGAWIEFLHRVDDQVKIRGYRIELGEIEAGVKRHSGVRQCVAVVQGDDAGDKSLVAFVVPSDSNSPPSPAELRQFLAASLPGYMIPAHFVNTADLPLTPNGKIDRKKLALSRRPQSGTSAPVLNPPRTAIEMQITRIWEQLLVTKVPDIDESFFDLGGHSLLAVRLVSTVQRTFKAEITIPAFLRAPTVAGLARLVERAGASLSGPKLIPLHTGNRSGTVVLLGSGVGMCRLGQALQGLNVFATLVPFAVSSSGVPTLEGRDVPPGLSEMASVYVDLIYKNIDNSGPCVLVGHSFTGLLAFEIAQQLERRGQAVDLVVLLDAWAREVPWHWKLLSLSFARARITRIACCPG